MGGVCFSTSRQKTVIQARSASKGMRVALRAGSRIPLACASGFHGAGVEARVIPGGLTHYTDLLLADAVPRKDPIDEVGAKFDTGHLADRGYRLMEQSGHDRLVTRSAAAD
jgi:hypothetical protein